MGQIVLHFFADAAKRKFCPENCSTVDMYVYLKSLLSQTSWIQKDTWWVRLDSFSILRSQCLDLGYSPRRHLYIWVSLFLAIINHNV